MPRPSASGPLQCSWKEGCSYTLRVTVLKSAVCFAVKPLLYCIDYALCAMQVFANSQVIGTINHNTMSLTITVTFPLNLWVLFWNVYGSSKLPVLSLYRQHPNVRSSSAILSPQSQVIKSAPFAKGYLLRGYYQTPL